MNKKLKQILNRYPMLEEDRNYIANLANGGGSGINNILIGIFEEYVTNSIESDFNIKFDILIPKEKSGIYIKIDKDKAHNILDLNSLIINERCTYKLTERRLNEVDSKNLYVANGQYLTISTYDGPQGCTEYVISGYMMPYALKLIYAETEQNCDAAGLTEGPGWYITYYTTD